MNGSRINELKKHISKILDEEIGRQEQIFDSSKYFATYATDELSKEINKLTDEEKRIGSDFTISVFMPEKIKDELNISLLTLIISYKNSTENKVDGKFAPSNTSLDGENFKVIIDVDMFISSDAKSFKNDLEYIISHELHHAYVYIKKLNKNSKSNVYNKTKNAINFEGKFKENPAIKEFLKMFYLCLPEEVSARVQEVASQLSNMEKTNVEDTLTKLEEFQQIKDSYLMRGYNLSKIKEVDKSILEDFVQSFNLNLKMFSAKNVDIKIINNPDSFFKYWLTFININGQKLYRKILKLVAEKIR